MSRAGSSITTEAARDTPALSAVTGGRYNDSGQRVLSLRNVRGCSSAFQYSRKPSTTRRGARRCPGGAPHAERSGAVPRRPAPRLP